MASRYRWSRIVIFSAILSAGTQALGQHCVAPASFSGLVPTKIDYENSRARTDYHLFLLSWAPVFCASQSGTPVAQCLSAAPSFVAGGLIPRSQLARREQDHPRHCIPPMTLSQALLRRNYCLTPSAQFMQDEWVRYGGCSFANAGEFFDRIAQLWSSIQQPDLAALARNSGSLTVAAIRQSFVTANSRIGLQPRNVIVSADAKKRFTGVAICYDQQFVLTNCPSEGVNDQNRLKLLLR